MVTKNLVGHCTNQAASAITCQHRTYDRTITISDPFSGPPQVVLSLSQIDATPGTLGEQKVNNVRISVFVVGNPDKNSFTYRVETWDGSRIWGAGISWIAIGA